MDGILKKHRFVYDGKYKNIKQNKSIGTGNRTFVYKCSIITTIILLDNFIIIVDNLYSRYRLVTSILLEQQHKNDYCGLEY